MHSEVDSSDEDVSGLTREDLEAKLKDEKKKRKAAEEAVSENVKAAKTNEAPETALAILDSDSDVDDDDRRAQQEQIREAFRQPYKGELDPEIVNQITRLLNTYNSDIHLSPFVAFFQSSGWGKTRFFAELSQKGAEHIVYLHVPCLNGGNGYPRPDPLPELESLLKTEFANPETQVQAWKEFLLRVLLCAVSVSAAELWSKLYVDLPGSGLQYSEYFKSAMKTESLDNLQTLDGRVVVVIDEAARMGTTDKGIEHWRALRRALRDVALTAKVRVLAIAVATVSAGAQLHPSRHSDPSLRGSLAKKGRFPPLSGLTVNLDKAGKGRPLWSRFTPQGIASRTQFAAEKLLCTSPLNRMSDYNLFPRCSMTLSRVPFVLPRHASGDLVGSHMATVLDVGVSGDSTTAGYLSDPYLAQGAAFAAKKLDYNIRSRLDDIASLFSTSVHNNGSAGDVGEIGVCIVLLDAMDSARLAQESDPLQCFSTCSPVQLGQFLHHLLVDCDVDSFHPNLKSAVNFTHFTRVFSSATLETADFAAKLWERGAAVVCPPGYPGIDLMIPALHESSTPTQHIFFWVMFQAKNYNDEYSVPLSAMTPQERRFVRNLEPAVNHVECGGLYLLLNLRGKPLQSPLKVQMVIRSEKAGKVTYASRCVRVPDRSCLRPLEGCASAWTDLMGLHRLGDSTSAQFSRDEHVGATMHLSATHTLSTRS